MFVKVIQFSSLCPTSKRIPYNDSSSCCDKKSRDSYSESSKYPEDKEVHKRIILVELTNLSSVKAVEIRCLSRKTRFSHRAEVAFLPSRIHIRISRATTLGHRHRRQSPRASIPQHASSHRFLHSLDLQQISGHRPHLPRLSPLVQIRRGGTPLCGF